MWDDEYLSLTPAPWSFLPIPAVARSSTHLPQLDCAPPRVVPAAERLASGKPEPARRPVRPTPPSPKLSPRSKNSTKSPGKSAPTAPAGKKKVALPHPIDPSVQAAENLAAAYVLFRHASTPEETNAARQAVIAAQAAMSAAQESQKHWFHSSRAHPESAGKNTDMSCSPPLSPAALPLAHCSLSVDTKVAGFWDTDALTNNHTALQHELCFGSTSRPTSPQTLPVAPRIGVPTTATESFAPPDLCNAAGRPPNDSVPAPATAQWPTSSLAVADEGSRTSAAALSSFVELAQQQYARLVQVHNSTM